jgi:hypothetical protein
MTSARVMAFRVALAAGLIGALAACGSAQPSQTVTVTATAAPTVSGTPATTQPPAASVTPSTSVTTVEAPVVTTTRTVMVVPPRTRNRTVVRRVPAGPTHDCRVLLARGYDWDTMIDYWYALGQPADMDNDGNGWPCETVYGPYWDHI